MISKQSIRITTHSDCSEDEMVFEENEAILEETKKEFIVEQKSNESKLLEKEEPGMHGKITKQEEDII